MLAIAVIAAWLALLRTAPIPAGLVAIFSGPVAVFHRWYSRAALVDCRRPPGPADRCLTLFISVVMGVLITMAVVVAMGLVALVISTALGLRIV